MRALQQPENRQALVSLVVVMSFLTFHMHQSLELDYLWAGLWLVGAVCFILRK